MKVEAAPQGLGRDNSGRITMWLRHLALLSENDKNQMAGAHTTSFNPAPTSVCYLFFSRLSPFLRTTCYVTAVGQIAD